MKYILKRNDNDYVIGADEQGRGGYNVVPLSVDPSNKYTIEEIEAYLAEHPEDLLDSEALELSAITAQSTSKRDSLITDVEWRRDRHQDEVLLGRTPTEPLLPVLEYIQALRDITSQVGFPNNITWPTIGD